MAETSGRWGVQALVRQDAGPWAVGGQELERGKSAAFYSSVGGTCHGVGTLFVRVGTQVFEGFLALGDELFERRE